MRIQTELELLADLTASLKSSLERAPEAPTR